MLRLGLVMDGAADRSNGYACCLKIAPNGGSQQGYAFAPKGNEKRKCSNSDNSQRLPQLKIYVLKSSMRRYAKRDRVKALHIPAVRVGKEEGHLRSRLRTNAKFPPP
jgi:hypothetical protein